MDDNNRSQPQNQPPAPPLQPAPQDPVQQPPQQPIQEPQPLQEAPPTYETIQVGETGEPLQPEEIPADISSPDEATAAPQTPADMPPGDLPPPVYQESKSRYFLIAGGAVFFIVIFILLLKLFVSRPPTKKVALNYWGLWEDKAVIDPLIQDYQSKNPNVTITYQKMDPKDYRQKVIVRSKNGQGPDLFRFHNTWLPEMQEVVAPLPSQIMGNSEFEKTFYPIHASDLKVGTHYYGIPLEIDGLVLIYNDDLLKKGGYTKPPANLDELANPDFLSKFTFKNDSGQLQSSAIALGTAGNIEHFSDIFGLMLIQNGANINKLDSPEAAGALESYRKFAETGIWDDSMDNSIAAFTKGSVAMIIAPSWEIANIKSANPDLVIKSTTIPFNLPGNQPKTLATYWVEGVSKYSKNQVEAWKFLKFLSSKESETKLFELQSKTRLFGEPYSRVDLADKLATNSYLNVFAKQQDGFVSIPTISRTYDSGLNDEIVTYLENAINAAAQGVSYQEAMNTAKNGVDQVLQKFHIN